MMKERQNKVKKITHYHTAWEATSTDLYDSKAYGFNHCVHILPNYFTCHSNGVNWSSIVTVHPLKSRPASYLSLTVTDIKQMVNIEYKKKIILLDTILFGMI